MNTQVEPERIVILGGSSGIGLATAERAAADGATVIVASSSPERIDAALERLPASAEGYTVDVRREEQIRDLFSRLGGFDHLAFTAGETLQIGAIADTDLQAAQRALDVRLWGAYAAAKHAKAHLRPGGSIVLSSGIAGTRPEPNWTVAAAICGALDALTRAQAQGWLASALAREPRTVLLVTHDVEEAVVLADRVLVLSPRPGRLVAELPGRPATDADLLALRQQALEALRG